ncbi:MAG: dihydropteroate synthase [Dehalococcoidales bacterium]|nr:dihydropteroate synthase [Dehalococcoidales bacterium]
MILIGENLNIVSTTIGPALKSLNAKPLQELAIAETVAGMDYLDINIGPARKDGDKFMEWVVKTVQEVTDKPLSLDTTNPIAMEAGLKAHKGRALLNSISLQRMEEELPFVLKYDCDFVGLTWGREGMPRDANERGAIAAELLYNANEKGIPNDRIWVDPIVTPAVNIESNQVRHCLEFMSMLQDIAPGAKSVVGLSNVSNGAPARLRPYLNRTYLMMLMKYNLYAAIVDAFDKELFDIAHGKNPQLVKLVQSLMAGEKIDPASVSPEEAKYIKTARVLLGEVLYSHSWLES